MQIFCTSRLAQLFSVAALSILSICGLAQTLPPIYEKTPVAIAPTKSVAEFPQGTFLENIALAPNGDLYVTSYVEGKVYKVSATGQLSVLTIIDRILTGIVLNPDCLGML